MRGRRVQELDTVLNAYRTHLGSALAGARAQAEESLDAFAVTRRAMDAQAWVGGESAEFARLCAVKGADAGAAAGEGVSALETRFAAEPERVDRSDRRARFS